jgi:hypothetical protein
MPADNARVYQFEDSRSSNVRVREHRAVVLVERRVARWATVLRCVRANVVRCIRRAICQHLVAARWAQAVPEWLDVRWVLDRGFRLREPPRLVRVRVHRRRIADRVSVIKVLAVSRKDQ